jgi:adhesin transport system membrane fusion protein
MLIGFLSWAAFARLEIAVNGNATVIPSQRLQVVQSLEGGVIDEILVAAGQRVTRNDVLLRIDDADFSARLSQAESEYRTLLARHARLAAELKNSEPEYSADLIAVAPTLIAQENEILAQRVQQQKAADKLLEEEVSAARIRLEEARNASDIADRQAQLLMREYQMARDARSNGAVSEGEYLEVQRQQLGSAAALNNSRSLLAQETARLGEAKAALDEARHRIKAERLQAFSDADKALAAAKLALQAEKKRVARRSLRSPVDGVVKRLLINTEGGVSRPGDALLEIVPDGDSITLTLPVYPRDIGFLRPGQTALLRFSAYDPRIYGHLEGVVHRIAADTLMDPKGNAYYEVQIETAAQYIGDVSLGLKILAGMQAQVHIITGSRSVLDYLLKPLYQLRASALRER